MATLPFGWADTPQFGVGQGAKGNCPSTGPGSVTVQQTAHPQPTTPPPLHAAPPRPIFGPGSRPRTRPSPTGSGPEGSSPNEFRRGSRAGFSLSLKTSGG